MATTADRADRTRQDTWAVQVNLFAAAAVLLLGLAASRPASAAIIIDPGTIGETFTSKSFDVTAAVRAAGVRNANGSLVVLDFVFDGLKELTVNGDGVAITATLETRWATNPSGIGNGFSLLFGDANTVVWNRDGSLLFDDTNPTLAKSPNLSPPPSFFDITGTIATDRFATYLVTFDELRFDLRLPSSSNLGFPATIPEEQLVLTSATLEFSSIGRDSGVPGFLAFSQYSVSAIPEPNTTALTAMALLSFARLGRRRRSPRESLASNSGSPSMETRADRN